MPWQTCSDRESASCQPGTWAPHPSRQIPARPSGGPFAAVEYRSAEGYVQRLRAEGFTVEAGSAGMPTAFGADWSNGDGPIIGLYAEYDVVPGNCQAASTPARASGWAIRRAGIPIRIRALASAGLAGCWPPRRRWKSMG